MPKCELCGLTFTIITASHLKYSHNMSTGDYMIMFPQAKMRDEDIYSRHQEERSRSISDTWWNKSEEERDKIKDKLSEVHTGIHPTDETRLKQSISATERQSGAEYQLRQGEIMHEVMLESWKRPEYRKLKIEQLTDLSRKRWADPIERERMLKAQREGLGQDEAIITLILEEAFPSQWGHTATQPFIGGGKTKPDWTHKTLKKVIEYDTYYWHQELVYNNPELKIAYYKKLGYGCLILEPSDLWIDGIVPKVKKFLED